MCLIVVGVVRTRTKWDVENSPGTSKNIQLKNQINKVGENNF